MPFTIVRQDITKMKVDAIVNAANHQLLAGGGVCGAIFAAAGADKLAAACAPLAPVSTGDAAITPGFGLPAKYVIHAVGPIYHHWKPADSRKFLYSAYTSALKLAVANGCTSIAFPLISSGIYGYPKEEALQVATEAIADFLKDHELDVYLAVFDRKAFAISSQLLGEVADYLDEHLVDDYERRESRRRGLRSGLIWAGLADDGLAEKSEDLDSELKKLAEPFSTALLKTIDARGLDDVTVYKRANLDRRLFAKIRKGDGYLPSKKTALALAIALELNLNETANLLARAGYALSPAQMFDMIIEFFIKKGDYNIMRINEVLFQYDQPLLGG